MARAVMVIVGRVVLGLLLAVAFSVIGIGIAWGLFVFWGGSSHATLITLFMVGSGLGAGLGCILAWLRIDQVPSRPVIFVIFAVLALAGAGGAWSGFQFGATQEVECCVGPAITPISYTAMGATLLSNLVALALGVFYQVRLSHWSVLRRT